MKVKIILNPYANRWGAGERRAEVEAACAAAGLAYDITVTSGPGQGRQAAQQAAQQAAYDAVVAAGGDGTLGEVINGLITAAQDGPTIPFGVIPIGTANDFGDMTELPRDVAAAVQVIAAGKTRQIDAGRVKLLDGTHYFDNNSALAMEPMVTLENIKMTRLSGNLRYITALVRALIKLKAWQMRVIWDDGDFKGPAYLLSVCNTPRTGGVFLMAPGALMDDGLLDFVLVPEVSKGTLLALLGRLFKGTHVAHPQVHFERTTHLRVESQPGTPIHVDGEIISEAETSLEYRVLPGKITLLTP
ncbi:MAG: diacylglycerol/lipid kinase family protein [Anaerolineae bacterium]